MRVKEVINPPCATIIEFLVFELNFYKNFGSKILVIMPRPETLLRFDYDKSIEKLNAKFIFPFV